MSLNRGMDSIDVPQLGNKRENIVQWEDTWRPASWALIFIWCALLLHFTKLVLYRNVSRGFGHVCAISLDVKQWVRMASQSHSVCTMPSVESEITLCLRRESIRISNCSSLALYTFHCWEFLEPSEFGPIAYTSSFWSSLLVRIPSRLQLQPFAGSRLEHGV